MSDILTTCAVVIFLESEWLELCWFNLHLLSVPSLTTWVPKVTNITSILTISVNSQYAKNALIFCQILSTNFLRKYIEISVGNLFVDIAAMGTLRHWYEKNHKENKDTAWDWSKWLKVYSEFSLKDISIYHIHTLPLKLLSFKCHFV